MIDPKDEVFRDLDDQGREDDNNRSHFDAGFLGDEEQDTESGNVVVEHEEGHQIPKAMTIEQEGEKPWENISGSTNLTEEQLEEVPSPSTNTPEEDAATLQPETEGAGYREEPDQAKVGGEE
ncbi:hypothetical protein [uncultured Mucilaginibacter sp.]|uniref:hypothetical protein n=1 Tax=uncultured Mucilaginibacter sp. TaxID=797541 RepID=UPI002603B97C|nr:hypothetical protein [uncultured Mucilaginibacter sp.]